MSFLLQNLLHFSHILRELGLDVPAGRTIDVVDALQHVDVGRRSDVYFALQTLLVHREQDLPLFDEAFRVFWRPGADEWTTTDRRAMGERRRSGKPRIDVDGSQPTSDDSSPPVTPDPIERVAPQSYSAQEILRTKDFAALTDEELEQARAMIATLSWRPDVRRTRRWVPGRGRVPDIRRVVQRNLRYGGEWFDRPSRVRTSKRRPLVVLCDVSGSMERYARMLLHFMHGLAGGPDRVEAFVFATRLTRLTREWSRDRRLDAQPFTSRLVPDWAGGTRIGEALRSFNMRWRRRVMSRGPVVLLISDGWDRGEPEVLSREMRRLRRSCHRLIWLNPLLGSADYQPITRGMMAALPFVDDFLPVHNFVSLEALARHLNALPPRGGRIN